MTDFVAQVFLGWRTKIFRDADACCAWPRGGPTSFLGKNDHGPA